MDFEGIYCFDTASVRFAFYPDGDDGARILGLISEVTLRDAFNARDGSGDNLLATCRQHFNVIRQKAIGRYRAEPSQAVVLTTPDFAPPVLQPYPSRPPRTSAVNTRATA